jgi:hypothetical protein
LLTCVEGAQPRLPFVKAIFVYASEPSGFVHVEVWALAKMQSDETV